MIKKVTVLVVAIFISSNLLTAQEQKLIESILEITKEQSIYKDNVDWNIVDKKVKEAVNSKGNSIFEKISPAVSLLLDELNDGHSFIKYKDQRAWRATQVDFFERINEQTKKARKLTDQQKIKTFRLEENIGYIEIPAIDPYKGASEKELAQILRDALCKLNLEDLKGIIVDLRLNTGGDMWPILSGIAPLLKPGKIGYTIIDGEPKISWSIKKGNVYYGNKKRIKIKSNCETDENIKIALLIGPSTGSSGEMTAISFIGQSNTKLFGERTAGYVTGNNTIHLEDDLDYFLASSYVADRNKNEYKKAIDPDVEIIGGDNYDNLSKDKKISEALKWIGKN